MCVRQGSLPAPLSHGGAAGAGVTHPGRPGPDRSVGSGPTAPSARTRPLRRPGPECYVGPGPTAPSAAPSAPASPPPQRSLHPSLGRERGGILGWERGGWAADGPGRAAGRRGSGRGGFSLRYSGLSPGFTPGTTTDIGITTMRAAPSLVAIGSPAMGAWRGGRWWDRQERGRRAGRAGLRTMTEQAEGGRCRHSRTGAAPGPAPLMLLRHRQPVASTVPATHSPILSHPGDGAARSLPHAHGRPHLPRPAPHLPEAGVWSGGGEGGRFANEATE
jgi:hypothetical protein